MKNMNTSVRLLLMCFLMLVMLTESCVSVRLISEYDEVTDQTATELQKKVSNYFVKLERVVGTDEAEYINFVPQFDEMKVDISTLEIRAAAFDKNRIVQESVVALKSMVINLDSLHRTGFSSYDQIKPLKQPFNSAFSAILKLQLALKRGDKSVGN